jgi:hypothetical protein
MSSAGPLLPQRRLGPWARAAFVLSALWLAWTLSSLVLRLGLASAWDEVELQSLLRNAFDGQALYQGLGRGTLWLRSLASLLWLPGFQAGWLHAPVLLGILLEAWLLWRLARQLGGGPEAAFAAVAVHLCSRLTWMRASTVLGYSLAPLWALGAWCLGRRAQGRWQGLAAGIAAGLLLGDYEGGLAALPAMAFLAWRRRRKAAGPAFAAGLVVALCFLAWLLPAWAWADYSQVRGASLRAGSSAWEAWQNLAAFFAGTGKPLMDAGLGAALWPLALPFVLLGLRRLPAEAWLLLLGGLATLLLPAPGQVEAHRAAVAWAPLCLAAGLGAGPWLARLSRAAVPLACALSLAALAWGHTRFDRQQADLEPSRYDYSWRLERAARRLQGEPVLSELSFRSLGTFRLRHHDAATAGRLPAWALLSGEQTGPRPDPAWGVWHPIQQSPEGGTLWALRVPARDQAHWSARERMTRSLVQALDGLPWSQQLELIRLLLQEQDMEPFFKRLLLDRALWAAKDVGLPLDLALACADAPWLGVRECLGLAQVFEASDPRRALGLVERALRLEPRRPGAQRFRTELLERLKP